MRAEDSVRVETTTDLVPPRSARPRFYRRHCGPLTAGDKLMRTGINRPER